MVLCTLDRAIGKARRIGWTGTCRNYAGQGKIQHRPFQQADCHLQRIDRTDLIPYIQYDTKHAKGGI